MSDQALMALHTAALFRYDVAGRMVGTNEPDPPGPAPRLYIGRTTTGNVWRFRHDLPHDLARDLDAILAREPGAADLRQPPRCLDLLQDALATHGSVTVPYAGPAWYVPDAIQPPLGTVALGPTDRDAFHETFPWLAAEWEDRQPCLAVLVEGVAVSLCFSARRSDAAAEAGLETLPTHRGRGYAAAVTAAWARAVRASGRVPLYSTSWDNLASQGVARRLGLILYGADFSIT